jgi:aldehyde dehydrogenase (NAD+)
LKSGDPTAEDTYIGPLINAAAQENYQQAVAAVEKSGRILVGGATPKGEGWNVQATLSEGLPPVHKLLHEETFAPLAHLVSLSSVTEAIETANSVRFGLTASIHTQDLEAAHRLASALNTGMIKVNAPTAGVDFHAPFGGSKDSSYGMREQGKAALNFYTYTRTIAISSGKRNIE